MMESQVKDDIFYEIAEARANFYQFFAGFFLKPPTNNSLQDLKERLETLELRETFSDGLVDKMISELTALKDETSRIVQEFHNLFLVPASQYVTPYESCFRETRIKKGKVTKGLLMGKSTRQVVRFYKENGLVVSREFKDLPDHVVLELQLMGTLCQKEHAAWQKGDRSVAIEALAKEKQFLEEHVLQWIPDLCDEICDKTAMPLYQGIARMTREFLEIEHNTFKEVSFLGAHEKG
jgi:TorA maturation chaperone TorD